MEVNISGLYNPKTFKEYFDEILSLDNRFKVNTILNERTDFKEAYVRLEDSEKVSHVISIDKKNKNIEIELKFKFDKWFDNNIDKYVESAILELLESKEVKEYLQTKNTKIKRKPSKKQLDYIELDDNDFWLLLDFKDNIVNLLSHRQELEIFGFEYSLQTHLSKLNSDFVINQAKYYLGSVTDDGLLYFKCAIILSGREVFYSFMNENENLKKLEIDNAEWLLYVSDKALRLKGSLVSARNYIQHLKVV